MQRFTPIMVHATSINQYFNNNICDLAPSSSSLHISMRISAAPNWCSQHPHLKLQACSRKRILICIVKYHCPHSLSAGLHLICSFLRLLLKVIAVHHAWLTFLQIFSRSYERGGFLPQSSLQENLYYTGL